MSDSDEEQKEDEVEDSKKNPLLMGELRLALASRKKGSNKQKKKKKKEKKAKQKVEEVGTIRFCIEMCNFFLAFWVEKKILKWMALIFCTI